MGIQKATEIEPDRQNETYEKITLHPSNPILFSADQVTI